MSRSHCSCSGQDTAQVPKSAMCWYFVSRSMAFCRIFGIFAKNRTVAGKQILRVVVADAVERLNEARQVRAMMGVDGPDAAILVDVVAAEKQVAEFETELARRVAGRVPDLQLELADLDFIALFELHVDLARRHRDVEVLGRDAGVGLNGFAGLE